jgi:hypothetical protein
LERLIVHEWQLYQTSNAAFDSTMAQHIANTLLEFAKELGKPAADLLRLLSGEDGAKFQQMLAAKGGGKSGAGHEIRELLELLQGQREDGAEEAEEAEGGVSAQTGAAVAAGGKDAGKQRLAKPKVAEAAVGGQEQKEEEEDVAKVARQKAAAVAEDTSSLAVTRLPDLDLVMQLLEQDGSAGRRLVFSTWDYGGQHVFRIVHHLFLTRFAVYLAVFNMDDLVGAQATDATANKCLTELHGWLSDLWMHAAEAPVVLVGTHKDMIDDSPPSLKRVDELLRVRFAGTKFWPFLRGNDKDGLGFFGVDSKSRAGDERGEDATVGLLRIKVEELAKGEKYIDKQLPMKWLLVLDALEVVARGGQEGKGAKQGKQQQEEDGEGEGKAGPALQPVRRVSLSRMHAIGQQCGLPSDPSLTLAEEVGALLDLFHELGLLVHYNDAKLRCEWVYT